MSPSRASRSRADRSRADRSRASRSRADRRPVAGRVAVAGAGAGAAVALCVWLAAAAVAAQASTAAGGALYHHPDHDELPEETFVPQSAVTGADRGDPSGRAPAGDLPPGAGRIIGSPDPGPDPQHSGDRGGWRQLVLLGALAAAVTAIMGRVLLAARRHDQRQAATAP